MIIPFGCIFWLRQKINKTVMKKFTIKFIPTLIMFLIPLVSFAQDVGYKTLVGLPGLKSSATGEVDFDTFINSLYAMSIGIAALLAVIKIIIAGVKYMLTDIITSKEEAKKDIKGALIGLLVVLGAVLILLVINPQLVNINFQPKQLAPPGSGFVGVAPIDRGLAGDMGPNDKMLRGIEADSFANIPANVISDLETDVEKAGWICENVDLKSCTIGVGGAICSTSGVGKGARSEAFCYAGEWDEKNQSCIVRKEKLDAFKGEGCTNASVGGSSLVGQEQGEPGGTYHNTVRVGSVSLDATNAELMARCAKHTPMTIPVVKNNYLVCHMAVTINEYPEEYPCPTVRDGRCDGVNPGINGGSPVPQPSPVPSPSPVPKPSPIPPSTQ